MGSLMFEVILFCRRPLGLARVLDPLGALTCLIVPIKLR